MQKRERFISLTIISCIIASTTGGYFALEYDLKIVQVLAMLGSLTIGALLSFIIISFLSPK